MKALTLFTSLFILAVSTVAQDKDVKVADPNLRAEREITLALEGSKTQKIKVPAGEYLSKDRTLTLYPGDKIHVEFDEANGKLTNPHVVAKITNKNRAITFSMSQDVNLTMLSRNTGIQQTVAMDCEHRGLAGDGFSRTNLRPTEKGMGSYDSWPNTVWTLRLKNIEVTTKSASEVYTEKVSK